MCSESILQPRWQSTTFYGQSIPVGLVPVPAQNYWYLVMVHSCKFFDQVYCCLKQLACESPDLSYSQLPVGHFTFMASGCYTDLQLHLHLHKISQFEAQAQKPYCFPSGSSVFAVPWCQQSTPYSTDCQWRHNDSHWVRYQHTFRYFGNPPFVYMPFNQMVPWHLCLSVFYCQQIHQLHLTATEIDGLRLTSLIFCLRLHNLVIWFWRQVRHS